MTLFDEFLVMLGAVLVSAGMFAVGALCWAAGVELAGDDPGTFETLLMWCLKLGGVVLVAAPVLLMLWVLL